FRNAFYHIIVDTEGAHVLHDPDKGGAWGAGPSMHKYAIHIELKNYRNKSDFNKSYKNYVDTILHYAKKYGIPVQLNTGSNKKGIYTHSYVTQTFGGTTHTDPIAYFKRHGKTLTQFGKDLESGKPSASTGGSSSSSSSSNKKPAKGADYNTKSIVTFLNSIGKSNSFNYRKKLAGYYKVGGGNYKGTEAQNVELLQRIKKDYKKRGKLRTSAPKSGGSSKSISKMADEVLAGKHGAGHSNRRKSLGVSKSTYEKDRKEVNRKAGGGSSSGGGGKSISTMANEIINGKGVPNGHEARRKWLGISSSQYKKVRAEVNKRLSGGGSSSSSGASVSSLASKIINGKSVPNGHAARRKWLGVSKAKYEQVRKEVNRRLG